ncbi:MAG TPA: MFS transporter [Anaerolineae bacterium]|nr:MFS transporter [Anaerolineae bacterium]
MTIHPSRRFRLTMFAALYIVQGIGLAYFHNFQKPYLDSIGVNADAIGALTFVLQVPFILKIFIGMLSDRVALFGMGHRKPYILLGLVLAAVSFGAATFAMPDAHFMLFAGLVTLGSFSVTLFDSTADGLAIDTTPREEQGLVQGVMVSGRAAAFILLSLVFGMLVQRAGYRVVFPIIGLSMLLPLAWVARFREPTERDARARFQWGAFKVLGQPRFLLFAAYAVVYSIGSFGTDGLVTYFMRMQFDAAESLIGQYGALRGLGAVVGALVGGALVDRVGRKRSAYAAAGGISIAAALFGLATGARGVLWLGLLWGVVWAFQETLFFALAMDIADARIAASMFAIMMGISNLGSAVSDGLATALSDNVGFTAVFWGLAVINLGTLPVLWGLFKKAPEIAKGVLETR